MTVTAGSHHFTAIESGTANYTGSTSAAVSLLVIPPPTTPAVQSPPTSLASTFNQQMAIASNALAVDQKGTGVAGQAGQQIGAAAGNTVLRLLGAAPETSSFDATGYQMLLTVEQTPTLPGSFDYDGTGQMDLTDLARVLLQ